MAISKEFLSGGANGVGVKVAATATPGTTIHTASATAKDEVHLYATNTGSAEDILVIEWGGVGAPDNHIRTKIPVEETVLVVPGLILSNSLVIKAFSLVANKTIIHGFVNRIT